MAKVLITGAAGFIGFHLANRLLREGHEIVGVDNLSPYYEVSLKQARLNIVAAHEKFTFFQEDISNQSFVHQLFESTRFDYVVNLAAQAGVRYSMTNPHAYIHTNILGFLNILEGCRHFPVKHLIYASSSSVYGNNRKIPFSVDDNVDHPISLYAASKKSNELMAHTYSSFYGIPSTGLRFFSAYGTYGRPDMALFIFTRSILNGEAINVFNHGKMLRDFTYIDDIVESLVRLLPMAPAPNPEWDAVKANPATSSAPYRVLNVGNDQPIELLHYIEMLETKLGKRAVKNFLPMQPGDIEEARADVRALVELIDFKPSTSVKDGIGKFVDWYLEYYKTK